MFPINYTNYEVFIDVEALQIHQEVHDSNRSAYWWLKP